MGSSRRQWLNQSTHSRAAYPMSSIPFHGLRRRISSVLYRPMIVCQGVVAGVPAGAHRGTLGLPSLYQ